jgi:hypothetical protein
MDNCSNRRCQHKSHGRAVLSLDYAMAHHTVSTSRDSGRIWYGACRHRLPEYLGDTRNFLVAVCLMDSFLENEIIVGIFNPKFGKYLTAWRSITVVILMLFDVYFSKPVTIMSSSYK